jgi:hypothetical protein
MALACYMMHTCTAAQGSARKDAHFWACVSSWPSSNPSKLPIMRSSPAPRPCNIRNQVTSCQIGDTAARASKAACQAQQQAGLYVCQNPHLPANQVWEGTGVRPVTLAPYSMLHCSCVQTWAAVRHMQAFAWLHAHTVSDDPHAIGQNQARGLHLVVCAPWGHGDTLLSGLWTSASAVGARQQLALHHLRSPWRLSADRLDRKSARRKPLSGEQCNR